MDDSRYPGQGRDSNERRDASIRRVAHDLGGQKSGVGEHPGRSLQNHLPDRGARVRAADEDDQLQAKPTEDTKGNPVMKQNLTNKEEPKSSLNAAGFVLSGKDGGTSPIESRARDLRRAMVRDSIKLRRHRERLAEERPGDSDAQATLI